MAARSAAFVAIRTPSATWSGCRLWCHRAAHDLRGVYPVREARARPPGGSEDSPGPWVVFAFGKVLVKALVYLGITAEQVAEHQDGMRRWGQGTSKLTIQPHRNLLRIDHRQM
jgi:hypothetical protein